MVLLFMEKVAGFKITTYSSFSKEEKRLMIFALFYIKLMTYLLYLYWHPFIYQKSICTYALAISIFSVINSQSK